MAEPTRRLIVKKLVYDTALAGISIFAASADDTRAIMNDDPGVRAGMFPFETRPVRGFPGASLP